jgi:hypothetical protein
VSETCWRERKKSGTTYIELFGPCELSTTNFITARHAQVELLEHWAAAVAGLRLAIRAGTVLETAHVTRSIIAVRTQDVGGCISDIRLGESGNESIRSLIVTFHGLFK